jgi:hypothetical protein
MHALANFFGLHIVQCEQTVKAAAMVTAVVSENHEQCWLRSTFDASRVVCTWLHASAAT